MGFLLGGGVGLGGDWMGPGWTIRSPGPQLPSHVPQVLWILDVLHISAPKLHGHGYRIQSDLFQEDVRGRPFDHGSV